jgi:hypothetical protein
MIFLFPKNIEIIQEDLHETIEVFIESFCHHFLESYWNIA